MENISTWVVNISTATIFVTIIGFFISSKKAFRCIKAVLALYILLTALSSQSFSAKFDWKLVQQSAQMAPTVDTQQIIKQNAEGVVLKEINNFLSAGKCINVTLSDDLSSVQNTIIECEKNDNITLIKKEIKESLGEKTNVVVNVRQKND